MACTCAPALLQLRDEVNLRWPKRDKRSDGCCASLAHSGQNPTSDHEPGSKGATPGYAHAYDLDEDLSEQVHDLGFLIETLLADSRTKYIIYWAEGEPTSRIRYPDGTWKVYTGVNDHSHHLHLSIKGTATFETRSWLSSLGKPATPATPDDEEDDVQLIYVRRKDQAKVHLASVKTAPRPVTLFGDAEWHAALTGDTVKPLASSTPSTEDVIDGAGQKRRVLVVADGSLYGL